MGGIHPPRSLAYAVSRNDLRVEARSHQMLGLTVVFAVLIPLVFRLAFDAGGTSASPVPVVWVTLLVVTVGGIGRSFHLEADRGMLDALLASPLRRSELFEGKLLSGVLVGCAAGLLSLLTTAVLLDGAVLSKPHLSVPVVVLGAGSLAALATVVSALTVRSKARGLLLPVVAFPLSLPLVVLGVQALQGALSPAGAVAADAVGPAVLGMVGYLAVLLVVGALAADRALEG